MKLWLKILAGLLVIVMAAVIAIPFFVDANIFRPTLETSLSSEMGRQVKLGNLRLSLLSGSLVADRLSIADDLAFSRTPFLIARQVRIGVDMKPLILQRQVHVRSFEIEAPQIHLVERANGQWNFSSLSRHAERLTSTSTSKTALFRSVVGSIRVQDGRAIVETIPAKGPPLVFGHVHLSLRNFSLSQRFPFELGATLPGNSAALIKGVIGPLDARNAAKSPADLEIAIQHLDPVTAGFLNANAGISVVMNIVAHATSDGSTVHSCGTLHMQGLQLRKTGRPSLQPIDLTYDIRHQMADRTGKVQQTSVDLGRGTIHLRGSYRLDGKDPWVELKVAATMVPIDEVESLMTAAGVKLPNGSQLKGGTLTWVLGINGFANDLVVTGPVELENAQLVGYDLGSKIAGIASLGGITTGSTTTIQTMRLNLQASHAGIQMNDIDGSILGLGRSTGSGTVSAAGVLSFRLVAHVTNSHGAGKVGVGLMTRMNQFGKSDSEKEAAQGVPILVTGTAEEPIITADVSGLMHRNASTVVNRVKHLFGVQRTISANH